MYSSYSQYCNCSVKKNSAKKFKLYILDTFSRKKNIHNIVILIILCYKGYPFLRTYKVIHMYDVKYLLNLKLFSYFTGFG